VENGRKKLWNEKQSVCFINQFLSKIFMILPLQIVLLFIITLSLSHEQVVR